MRPASVWKIALQFQKVELEKLRMRIASLIAGTVAGCLLAVAAFAQDGIELPPGPDRDLVYGKCRTCHDLQYLVESAGVPRNAWSDLLDSMKKYGLELSSADRGKILNYLATYLGPDPPPKATAAAPPAKVDGAQVFNEQCIACHQANGQGVRASFLRSPATVTCFWRRAWCRPWCCSGCRARSKSTAGTLMAPCPPSIPAGRADRGRGRLCSQRLGQ